jgi:hypothetical protein
MTVSFIVITYCATKLLSIFKNLKVDVHNSIHSIGFGNNFGLVFLV